MKAALVLTVGALLWAVVYSMGGSPQKPRRSSAEAKTNAVALVASPPIYREPPLETSQPDEFVQAAPAIARSVRDRLMHFEGDEIGAMEQEFSARVANDPAFAKEVFDVFLVESDPSKLSFLQNVLASDPSINNDPGWQSRFVGIAKRDALPARQNAALLFLQEAETIETVHDDLVALAERGGPVGARALLALEGLPGERTPDPSLRTFAERFVSSRHDPELRGIALRIAGNPAQADLALNDAEPYVRMQAARVATSRQAIELALRSEADPDARYVMERQLASLP